jgi:calcineurin-like phosphoesterase family protein
MACDLLHTFVTSDHHFGSSKLLGPFKVFSVEQEDELIAKWNSTVSSNDLVLYNGDFCDCCIDDAVKYKSKLNGHIVLIKGNHDTFPDFVYTELFDDVADEVYIENLDLHVKHKPAGKPGTKQVYGHMHRGYVVGPLDKKDSFCSCVQAHDGFPVLLNDIAKQLRLQTCQASC